MVSNPAFGISCPTTVRFGAGVAEEIVSYLPESAGPVLLLTGGSGLAAEPVRLALKTNGVQFAEAKAKGEPTVDSINDLRNSLNNRSFTAIIASGGGAVLDAGKALSFCLTHDLTLGDDFNKVSAKSLAQPNPLSLIVLPTTAGTGAEVTSNAVLGVPSKAAKISLRGPALFPRYALIDPKLMTSAPQSVVINSGLDAVTQIIEAYTSAASTPFSDALTEPQIEPALSALRRYVENPSLDDMTHLAWSALASGLALANGGLGAAHGLASVVGGRYAAPHGALCGRFLAPVLRQNLRQAEVGSKQHQRLDTCCHLISLSFPQRPGGDDLSGFEEWVGNCGLPRLSEMGVPRADLADLAYQSVSASSSRKNAVPLEAADYHTILEASF